MNPFKTSFASDKKKMSRGFKISKTVLYEIAFVLPHIVTLILKKMKKHKGNKKYKIFLPNLLCLIMKTREHFSSR